MHALKAYQSLRAAPESFAIWKKRYTLLNINKPNSRVRVEVTIQQHFAARKCALLRSFAKFEMCDPKHVTINSIENVKNKERWNKARTIHEQNKDEKVFFSLCERKSGWAGHGAQCCADRAKRTDKMIELYLFIFMYLFVTTKWKQSAFYRISRRARTAGSCRSPGLLALSPSHRKNGIHFVNLAVPLAHTALSLPLSSLYLALCLLSVRLNFIYSFCF